MNLRILFLLFVISNAFAQTGMVRGRVVDENRDPMIGAAVEVLHTTLGMSTGIDGSYVISGLTVGADTLRVHAVGYHDIVCPILLKRDSLTIADFEMAIIELDQEHRSLCMPGQKPPPIDYERTHSKVTYVPVNGTEK